tara:strand:- start:574 stop:795 length:222 start_codon:yes stop_codon:yes gene_type:complete
MRAVKGKNDQLSLISSFEAKLYSMAETLGSINATELSEQDAYLAEEMYKKNILNKKMHNGIVHYVTHSAKQKI